MSYITGFSGSNFLPKWGWVLCLHLFYSMNLHCFFVCFLSFWLRGYWIKAPQGNTWTSITDQIFGWPKTETLSNSDESSISEKKPLSHYSYREKKEVEDEERKGGKQRWQEKKDTNGWMLSAKSEREKERGAHTKFRAYFSSTQMPNLSG